ncbi:UMP kinase [bacterium]|nr:UMP kinase [bacterium]
MPKVKYKRILLKLSGESFSGEKEFGMVPNVFEKISEEILKIKELGVEIGIVLGGGNIFRGSDQRFNQIERATADYMGMLSTVINAIALQDYLEKTGMYTRVMSAINIEAIAEPFIKRRATRHLEKGRIVIFAAGTGSPYFTTDTAAVLRGVQVDVDVILKGTRVDGIYDSDPEKNSNAKKYEEITYLQLIKDGLKVMDNTAVTLCMNHKIPIIIFNMLVENNLKKVILGEKVGTIVEKCNDRRCI